MGAPRFFVDAAPAVGGALPLTLPLPAAVAHHALRVLRLRDGSAITLFNGRGGECRATLRVAGSTAAAQIEAFDPVERESPLQVTLLQAWIATDKLDWTVAKAVELGASAVLLYPAERSVVRLHGERQARRLAHLAGIAIGACEQCGRNRVPTLAAFESLTAALAAVADTTALALTPAAPQPLAAVAAAGGPLSLVIGPEGGLTPAELAEAQQRGLRLARLGPRVLRAETAGVAALAALQATAGDFAR